MIHRYDSNSSIREPVLQNAFILAVDRSRLVLQRNKGRALDCHYTEYSLHYNLCNQLAARIKESLVSASSAGYVQLQQQFNLQFNNPSSQQAFLSPSGNSGGPESRLNPVERLHAASEALHLSEYGMKEAISELERNLQIGRQYVPLRMKMLLHLIVFLLRRIVVGKMTVY